MTKCHEGNKRKSNLVKTLNDKAVTGINCLDWIIRGVLLEKRISEL